MDFTDKIVLVTGASRGIGREVARQFADMGAQVAVHYHSNRAAAEQTLASLAGDGHRIYQADVADPDAVRRWSTRSPPRWAASTSWSTTPGFTPNIPIRAVDYAEWQSQWSAILDTNLIGAANAIFCAAPHMIARGGGHVVNVSSRGAFRGEPLAPPTARARRA